MKMRSEITSKSYYFFYPGNINTKTGGYIYEKNILDHAKKLNFKISKVALSNNYPFPHKNDLNDLIKKIKKLPLDSILIFDGLILESLEPIIDELKNYKIIALIHHPLFLEFKGNISANFLSSGKKIFKLINHFIVTSKDTKMLLEKKFNVIGNKIEVVEPGIERLKQYKKNQNANIQLLMCGSIIERKNYLYILQELKFIENVTLNIVGDISRDNKYYKTLLVFIKRNKLEKKVKFLGKISNIKLSKLYSNTDFFISTSKYEGFGMSLANALILKIPIITYKTPTIVKTIGIKGILYFENFKIGNISALINKNYYKTKNMQKIKAQLNHNNRIFLTPEHSAKMFIEKIKNA